MRIIRLIILIAMTFPLLALQSCDREITGEEEIQNFYRVNPSLQGKITNLSTYCVSKPIWEVTCFYRFSINEKDAMIYLKSRNFIDSATILSASKGKRNEAIGYYSDEFDRHVTCNNNFMPAAAVAANRPLKWWNVSEVKDRICYLNLPFNANLYRKAMYDRQQGVLYQYSYRAR